MNTNRSDSEPIRLPLQVELPSQKTILHMVSESHRSKQRVELPLQPHGRPSAAILTVQYDTSSGKSSWLLYESTRDDACVVWGAADPDPSKVIQAMRDWSITARLAEGWTALSDSRKEAPEAPPPAPYPAAAPPYGTPAMPFPTLPPGMANPYMTPAMPFPSLPPQPPYPPPEAYPGAYGQPWQQPAYPHMPETAAPQHWVHAYPQPASQPLPPEVWMQQSGQMAQSPPLMLGDVLVAAGIIPTRTLHAALTLQNSSNMDRRRIGEILVNSGALPDHILSAAIRLQDMARTGNVQNHKVTDVLRRMHSTGESIEQALSDKVPPPKAEPVAAQAKKRLRPSDELLEREANVTEDDQKKLKHVMNLVKQLDAGDQSGAERGGRLLELFKMTTLVSGQDIDDARKAAKSTTDAMKSLLVKELIDPLTFEAGLDCQKLIDANLMRPEQAIIAIGYCQRSRVKVKEAISEMNWEIETDLL